jgi:uncharacterized membrane protein
MCLSISLSVLGHVLPLVALLPLLPQVKKLNLKSKSTGKKETGNRYITIFAKEQTQEEFYSSQFTRDFDS